MSAQLGKVRGQPALRNSGKPVKPGIPENSRALRGKTAPEPIFIMEHPNVELHWCES